MYQGACCILAPELQSLVELPVLVDEALTDGIGRCMWVRLDASSGADGGMRFALLSGALSVSC